MSPAQSSAVLRQAEEARARAIVARIEILLPLAGALVESLGDPDLRARLSAACAGQKPVPPS